MKKQRHRKLNIPVCAAEVLLCLTLISMYFVVDLYARYASSSSGSDSASVATFSITQEGTIFETIAADVTPGTTKSVNLVIHNSSFADESLEKESFLLMMFILINYSIYLDLININ